MAELVWTSSQPVSPGWYWMKKRGDHPIIIPVSFVRGTRELKVHNPLRPHKLADYPADTMWDGPIRPPSN